MDTAMLDTKNIQIHVIREDVEDDDPIAILFASHVPRVGDEMRFGEPFGEPDSHQFYRVVHVVWCYGEAGPFERVNLGVSRVF